MNDRPTREQLVAKVAEHIQKECGTDPIKIAEWAMMYAKRGWRDGYTQGQTDTMISLVKEFMRGEDEHASDLSAILQFLNAGGSGGAPRDGARPTPPGSTGVPAGEGSEAGEGVQPRDTSSRRDVRATGESTITTRKGDVQS